MVLHFFMIQYNNQRWVEHFKVTREVIVQITKKLKPLIQRKDTKYRSAILVGIRVMCSLYKISHGIDYLQYGEMFAIGKSLVNMVLRDFIFTINEVFKNQVQCPQGEDSSQVMIRFKDLYGLLLVHGAMDCTHIHIHKPACAFVADFYSYKLKAHNLQFQVVVDHDKHFCDVFVGLSSSMNDSRIMWLSNFYQEVTYNGLFNLELRCQDGICPCTLGDIGYFLLPCMIIPHKQSSNIRHMVLENVYNKKLSRVRNVVKNAFRIL